jgi:hypothetical protein
MMKCQQNRTSKRKIERLNRKRRKKCLEYNRMKMKMKTIKIRNNHNNNIRITYQNG